MPGENQKKRPPAKRARGPIDVHTKKRQGVRLYDRSALVPIICERLSKGETMTSICSGEGMPSYRAVMDWCAEDETVSAGIAQARVRGFDALADECLLIANKTCEGIETVEKADGSVEVRKGDMLGHRKLQIETRLKLLAKWDPKRYGEKQQIEHSGTIDVAGELMSARKRSGKPG